MLRSRNLYRIFPLTAIFYHTLKMIALFGPLLFCELSDGAEWKGIFGVEQKKELTPK